MLTGRGLFRPQVGVSVERFRRLIKRGFDSDMPKTPARICYADPDVEVGRTLFAPLT